jgi:hypothetical protein
MNRCRRCSAPHLLARRSPLNRHRTRSLPSAVAVYHRLNARGRLVPICRGTSIDDDGRRQTLTVFPTTSSRLRS